MINGVDVETLCFWWDKLITPETISDLTRESRWVYRSLDAWKEIALSKGFSVGLSIFDDSLLYSNSKRPINSMSMFRTPLSFKLNRNEMVDNTVELAGETWNVLPVTRYAAGMRRSLFWNNEETPKDFCGTFYYLEPESTTYLAYKTSYTSFSKLTAFTEMIVLLNKETEGELYSRLQLKNAKTFTTEEKVYWNCLKQHKIISMLKSTPLMKYVKGVLPRDLMMTPKEVDPNAKVKSTEKYYASAYLELYGIEDIYDQSICLLCKRLGYDVLILENMIGSFQVVTEVLDARDREDSFRSLIYLTD